MSKCLLKVADELVLPFGVSTMANVPERFSREVLDGENMAGLKASSALWLSTSSRVLNMFPRARFPRFEWKHKRSFCLVAANASCSIGRKRVGLEMCFGCR